MDRWKGSLVEGFGEKGMVLVAVVLIMSVLAMLGTTSLLLSTTGQKLSSNYRFNEEAIYIAQGGAEYGLNRLRAALKVSGGSTSSVIPPTIAGFTFENTNSYLTLSGSLTQKSLTGQFPGLTAYCQKYVITSSVLKSTTNSRATFVYDVEDQSIPLFQFGIFFHDDLEILPGVNMTFTGGPIHSNGSIYLFPSGTSTLSIDSVITSFNSIIHNRKDSQPGTAGTVNIKNAAGTYQSMNIDSGTTTWRADAMARWNGRVKSGAHDIQSLNMPLPSGGNSIDILGTGTQSLYAKSGLRITTSDGATFSASDKDGNVVILPAGLVQLNTFYDYREGNTMVAVDVDITKITGTALTALNNPPIGGQAKILYVSSSVTNGAVRLINGSSLPTGGLSVVTNNPLYIKGNYNNVSNLPAGIYADAVTVLSAGWNDSMGGYPFWFSWRSATADTTIRAAIMAGNKNTVGAQYGGGLDNFIRLLENWTGRTLTFSGSLACLWQSQQATGNFVGGSSSQVFRTPARNWSYGIAFANLPPGTPQVRSVQRIGQRQVFN